MYNFIYWFFFKFYEWKDKSDSTFLPSCASTVALEIHVLLIYSIMRYSSVVSYVDYGNLSYSDRKYLFLPFALLLFLVTWFFYYRRRHIAIMKKFDAKKPFTFLNITLVILIFAVPLLVAIRLVNLAVEKGG